MECSILVSDFLVAVYWLTDEEALQVVELSFLVARLIQRVPLEAHGIKNTDNRIVHCYSVCAKEHLHHKHTPTSWSVSIGTSKGDVATIFPTERDNG